MIGTEIIGFSLSLFGLYLAIRKKTKRTAIVLITIGIVIIILSVLFTRLYFTPL